MKYLFKLLLFLFFFQANHAQIQGLITDNNKLELSFVNIHLEDSTIGTTSNEQGLYELNLTKKGTYTIVFQFLGYKTQNKVITIDRKNLIYELEKPNDIVLKMHFIPLDKMQPPTEIDIF